MEFSDVIRKRYSVRKFEQRPVEQSALDAVLQAGLLAPTAKNLQPQRILVIRRQEDLEKLDRCTRCRFGAPCALLVCYDRDACWKRERYDGKPSGETDAAIVTTHMMLAAEALGIGTTWVMHFDPEAVRREFSVPEPCEPCALLVMGYPPRTRSLPPCISRRCPKSGSSFLTASPNKTAALLLTTGGDGVS